MLVKIIKLAKLKLNKNCLILYWLCVQPVLVLVILMTGKICIQNQWCIQQSMFNIIDYEGYIFTKSISEPPSMYVNGQSISDKRRLSYALLNGHWKCAGLLMWQQW